MPEVSRVSGGLAPGIVNVGWHEGRKVGDVSAQIFLGGVLVTGKDDGGILVWLTLLCDALPIFLGRRSLPASDIPPTLLSI